MCESLGLVLFWRSGDAEGSQLLSPVAGQDTAQVRVLEEGARAHCSVEVTSRWQGPAQCFSALFWDINYLKNQMKAMVPLHIKTRNKNTRSNDGHVY